MLLLNKKQECSPPTALTVRVGEFDEREDSFTDFEKSMERTMIYMTVASVAITGAVVYGIVKIVDAVVNRD